MPAHQCEHCAFRATYDNNPRAFLGRLWRFHIRFCPGWRRYMDGLPEGERKGLAERYQQQRYLRR